jgi:hypothetical protein
VAVLLRVAVVVGGGIVVVVAAVGEHGHRCLVGAGQQCKGGFQAELVADLEGDGTAVQVDLVDHGGVELVST